MHSQVFDFQDGDANFDIKFPAGEALRLVFENAPDEGQRIVTIGTSTNAPPLIEASGTAEILFSAGDLEVVPEGRLGLFNLWQRHGDALDLVAEGRFVRRAVLEPTRLPAPLQADHMGPLLLMMGDSVTHNIPGTRPMLEQMVGHKFRFPEGYQGAVGGYSAQDIWFATPEMVSRIVPGKTVVLVGPVGANQTPEDDSFQKIISYLDNIYSALLDAGAWVVAVPTLLDGMGVINQDAEKTALADWVRAYADGGTVSYEGVDFSVEAHERFLAVDTSGFDRNAMKSDVSHPNAIGARFLSAAIADVLVPLVDDDGFDIGIENLLGTAAEFAGSRPATGIGVTGSIPTQWDVARSDGSDTWACGFDASGTFELSVNNAVGDGTCVVSLPNVQVGADAGDILNFLVELEIAEGATGLKSVGMVGAGSTITTMNPDWALAPGTYFLRTRDEAFSEEATTQGFQIFVHVAPGASLTLRFKRATAFFAGNTTDQLTINGTAETDVEQGVSYAFTPTVAGGEPPYVFDLAGGVLPEGLAVNTNSGEISGVPTQIGTQHGIALQVRDALGATAVLPHFSIDVRAPVVNLAVWDSSLNTSAPVQLDYADQDRQVLSTADINGMRHTRGTQVLSGKRYFECTLGPNVLGVGIATDGLTAVSGGGFGTGRCFWSGSVLFYSGGTQGMGGALAEGDRIQVAVDVDAQLIWMRRNGVGDWNNSPAEDPAADAGGRDVSGMSGGLYAYAGLNNHTDASVVLHGTADRLTYTAPSGFSPIA